MSKDSLFQAVKSGNLRELQQLLNNVSYINRTNEFGSTLLHIAAKESYLDIVRLLIAYDINVNAKDNEGNTPLHLATCPDITNILLGRPEIRINIQNHEGDTPLTYAINRNNYLNIAKLLLKHGADANIPNEDGSTTLHCVIVRYAIMIKGENLLMSKEKSEYIEIAKTLLVHKANLNAQDNNGNTPVHLAVIWGSPELVELLVHAGAKLDLANTKGITPRETALMNHYSDNVVVIILKILENAPKGNDSYQEQHVDNTSHTDADVNPELVINGDIQTSDLA
jgi:ankyrin repeat protein